MRRLIAINAFIFLMGLIVLELIFGSWVFGPSWGSMNIPRDVRRTFDVSQLYGGPTDAVYTRDNWGLRGHYPNLATIDILTLGGSTTDQRFIADGQTWQDLLAQQLGGLSIVNAGVDGQSTLGHLATLDRWISQIPGLKARFMLAYIGINDLHLQGQQQWDDMKSPSRLRQIQQYIKNHSAIAQLVDTIRGSLKARKAHVVHGGSAPAQGPWVVGQPSDIDKAADPALLSAYGERVTALIKRIRALDSTPIIVTQSRSDYRVRANAPPLGRIINGTVSLGSWAEQSAYNRIAMQTCRQAQAICVDLGGELTFEDGDFYDWIHTTPSGNQRIATYLARILTPVVQRSP